MGEWVLMAIWFGVALIACAIGFKKFVWFLSIGYGFAVAALGIGYAVFGGIHGTLDIIGIVQCLLFVLYGARLSGFLLARELKNATYRKVLASATKEGEKKMPIFVLVTIWLMVGVLYVGQTAPVFYRMVNFGITAGWDMGATWAANPVQIILPAVGAAISLIGLVIETFADIQKSEEKKTNPHMVATHKLYKMVRCPNYFGEILFWTGVFVGGCALYNSWWQWVIVVISWISIVYIMINGAQRLDKRQEKNYGTKEEYRDYADHTPLIFPLIPVSHIGIYKVEDVEAAEKAKQEKKAAKVAKKESK